MSQTKKKYKTKKSINEKVKNPLLPWETSTKLNQLGLDVSPWDSPLLVPECMERNSNVNGT